MCSIKHQAYERKTVGEQTLVVLGYTGRADLDGDKPNHYIKLLDVLLSAEVAVASPDITDDHAAGWTGTDDLIKVLLKHNANVKTTHVNPLAEVTGSGTSAYSVHIQVSP